MSDQLQRKLVQQSAGMTLVMALLLLTVMMSSALALGRFIVSELKMSLNSTNAINAFYAADSGLEKALFYLKYGVDNSNLAIFDSLTSTPFTMGSAGASYSYRSATTTSPSPRSGAHTYTVFDISTSSPGTLPGSINIIDPSGNVNDIDWGPNSLGLAYSYKVYWKVKNCFPNHASDKLEVSHTSFANNFSNVRNDSNILICNCGYGSDWCDNSVSQFNMSDDRYYNFSFRPLDGPVAELSFDVFEDINPIGVKSEAFIDVQGNYHNASYSLQAKLPALNVISGVFSYIIFSEQPIIKNP